MTWTVVKVGGSLYDWPKLGERLRAWLAQLDAERVLIVPGGGATADAIRLLDRVHGLGEETSHWLAIQALTLNARFVQTLLPDCEVVSDLHGLTNVRHRLNVVDAFAVFTADEKHPDHLPHRWQVTSDSLAVRLAALTQARDLILLKSTAWPECDWLHAARAGIVDAYFAEALKQASSLRTRIVNLRAWLPDQTTGSDPATS